MKIVLITLITASLAYGQQSTPPPVVLPSAANAATGLQAPTANAAVSTYNVAAFGGKADATVTLNVSYSSGSNVLTGGGIFNAATDVGKGFVIQAWSTAPFSATPYTGYITAVNDSSHAVMSRTASASGNGLVIFGTDNSPAANACTEHAIQVTGGGTCHFTAGRWLFIATPYYLASDNNGSHFTAIDDGGYQVNVQPPAGGANGKGLGTISGGQVASVAVTNSGSRYKASATLQVAWNGNGCPTGESYRICGGPFVTAQTNSSGQISGFAVVNPGFGFTSAPTFTAIPLNGDGAEATATLTGSTMNLPTMTATGDGYGNLGAGQNLKWLAINSSAATPCTGTVYSATGVVPQVVGSGSVAIDSSGHASGTVTMAQTPTGCSASPTIIFGGVACNSGTLVSPVWGQCTDIAPLNPNRIPLHVMMVAGVNWTGEGGSTSNSTLLIGGWDQKSFDDPSTPVLFGGPLNHQDISGLTFSNAMMGIAASSYFSYGKIYNITGQGNGIDVWLWSQDLGGIMDSVYLNSYATIGIGGTWAHRADYPEGQGGEFNGQELNNFVSRPTTYNATANQVDQWFDKNFWRSDMSIYSAGVSNNCTTPLPPNQRQTSHGLLIPQGGSLFCYAGLASTGITLISRDNRGGGSTQLYNWQVKGAKRHMYYGYMNTFDINQFQCAEPCGGISADPYAPTDNSATSAAVIDDAGARLFNFGADGSFNRVLWSVPGGGDPTKMSWNNLSCAVCTHAQPVFNPNFANGFDVSGSTPAGISLGKNTQTVGAALSFYGRSGGTTNTLGGAFVWAASDVAEIASDGTTTTVEFGQGGSTRNRWFTSNQFASGNLGVCTAPAFLNCTFFSGATSTTRTVRLPDANSTTVQGSAGVGSNLLQFIDTSGVQHFTPAPATIASGTAAMRTGAVTTLTCATVVTVAATGTLTTDKIAWSFNAAPGSGWPGLTIQPYPTANNVNFLVCNPTAGSVTPAAATLNWSVSRP